MNPTSPATRSPGYALSPSSSPSSENQKSDHATFIDQAEWNVREGCVFPVYSERKNQEFRQRFDQSIKTISLHLQTMMTCLLENSCDPITTPWKAFSTLVSCLGEDFPKQIPLSLFTSSVVIACIKNIEGSPPAKKRKFSDSSEESAPRNKIFTSAQELANTISSTLAFLQTSVQLNKLKEKNSERHQAHRAFQSAVAPFVATSSTVLDNADCELSELIISAIAPQGDACSKEARDCLLRIAINEFVSSQELLICSVYTGLAYQKKRLPLTGKGLLAICIQHSAKPISVSENTEWLPSWQRLIFCYLARTFLQKMNVHMLHPTDCQSLLTALAPYVSACSSTVSQAEQMQSVTNFLANNFVRSYFAGSFRNNPQNFNLSIRYNEFAQCSSLITNLLKGFFILETNMCFSSQNLSSFQQYTQALHLPNTTEAIKNTIQEVASLCAEEHQNATSYTRSLLEKTRTLLHKLIFQSIKIAFSYSQGFKNKSPKEIVPCEWMTEEMCQSIPFWNYWKEAIWAHHAGMLSGEDFANDPTTLISTRDNTSDQLKNSFQQLCYNLLMDVLADMPLEYETNTLSIFLEKAQALQTNIIPKYAPTSYLFEIAIKFIAKSESFIARNMMFDIATQKFQKSQKDFILYIYNILIQNEKFIPTTPKALFAYLRKQGKQIPLFLEKLPFWQEFIFRFLAHIFLQQKQDPITDQHSLDHIFIILHRHFPRINLRHKGLFDRLKLLTQALSEALRSMKIKPFGIEEHTPSAIALDDTQYQTVTQSITVFNTLIQAFFKLDTGKNLSSKNLCMFQKYIHNFSLYIPTSYVREILSGSFAIYLEETELLDENSEIIKSTLAMISVLLKQLLEGSITILILHNKSYKIRSPQSAITEAFQIIRSDFSAPENLLLSAESFAIWKEIKQNPPKKDQLSKIPNHFKRTEKLCTEAASALTQCFLILCQKVLMGTSKELLLKCAAERPFQKQDQKRAELISFIYPKIILENYYNQSKFKGLVSFLETDMLHTSNPNVLMLAIENFLNAQLHLVKKTSIYSIQQKLELPLTGADFLSFCKTQYRSMTFFPLSLSTLPSWNNCIFCSLASIFLLNNQMQIAPDCQTWDPKAFIPHLAPFFPKVTNATENLPAETQIKTFTMCLAQYFRTAKSINIHDTDTHPYASRAYENFLRSSVLLKDLFRIFFTIETGKKYSSQDLQQFQSYIAKLLVNEPNIHKRTALQDVTIVCSEDIQSLEEKNLSQLWEDLTSASSLLQNLMELSLALILLCSTMETDLAPQKTFLNALKIICYTTSLPLSFINSVAAENAFQAAMNAYMANTLCLQFFKQTLFLSQNTGINPLQTAINEHLSGRSSPQITEHTDWLSSMLVSTEKTMVSLFNKLYTNLKTSVTAAISKEASSETSYQTFINTANACCATMIAAHPSIMPLFQSLVLILAKEYEEELKKELQEAFAAFITTAEGFTTEEEAEELPANIWQEISDSLLKEKNETASGKESPITTTPATETELSPDALWTGIEELLSAEDFTDLLGTETVQFEAEDEDAS